MSNHRRFFHPRHFLPPSFRPPPPPHHVLQHYHHQQQQQQHLHLSSKRPPLPSNHRYIRYNSSYPTSSFKHPSSGDIYRKRNNVTTLGCEDEDEEKAEDPLIKRQKILLTPDSPPPASPASPTPSSSSVADSKGEGFEAEGALSPQTQFKQPIIIPQTPSLTMITTTSFKCKLCGLSFKSEYDFLTHLTIIHYKDRLMKRVKPPYRCLKCNYVPAVADDSEDLLMHYGCDERFAIHLYEQDESIHGNDGGGNNSNTTSSESYVVLDGGGCGRITITCELCNSCFENERLFVRHVSLRHFTKQLCEDLPKRPPFICPFTDCYKEKANLHALMLHYGCEHNISMDLYLKKHRGTKVGFYQEDQGKDEVEAEDEEVEEEVVEEVAKDSSPTLNNNNNNVKNKKSVIFSCKKCIKRTAFVSQKSLNYHLMVSHFFPDLPKSGPYACPKCREEYEQKSEFAKHFLQTHLREYIEDPSDSSGQNCEDDEENESSFRKNNNNSDSGSGERTSSPKNTSRLKVMTTTHHRRHQKSEARQKITRRWERTSVDVQQQRIEELENKLKEMEEEHRQALKRKGHDFEKWILQKEKSLEEEIESRKNVEESLERSTLDVIELRKQLEQSQSANRNCEQMLVEKHSLNHNLMKEKKVLVKKVDNLQKEVDEHRVSCNDMEKSLKDLKTEFDSRGKEITDLSLSLNDKDEELKDANSEYRKEISNLKKNLAKLEKNCETLQKKLKSANDEKRAKIALVKENAKRHKETEAELKEQVSKLTKANKGLTVAKSSNKKLEEYEKKVKISSDHIDGLKLERDKLVESLEKLQRLMRDYETVLQEKNDKIREYQVKSEETEGQLKDLAEKANNCKTAEKEKRDLTRQVKQLQAALQDWEARHFSNLSSISQFRKEKAELETRLRSYEENNSGVEEEISQFREAAEAAEVETASLRTSLGKSETQNARLNVMLTSRNEELQCLQAKMAEMDSRIKSYEKELRKDWTAESLKSQLTNKNMEIHHLRVNLNQLKNAMSVLKTENTELKERIQIGSKEKETRKSCDDNILKDEDQTYVIEKDLADRDMTIKIKEEPSEEIPMINASNPSIVLNLLDVKNENVEKEFVPSPLSTYNSSDFEEFDFHVDEDDEIERVIFPGPSLQSPMETITESTSLSSSSSSSFSAASATSLSMLKKSSKPVRTNNLEDVTGLTDESEEVVCGICYQYDPPLPEDAPRCESYKTEWVGCDCDRWFHKICTKLTKFSTRFSCKSVKKKCLKCSTTKKI